MMSTQRVSFSIVSHAAWAPGIDSPSAWAAWAEAPFVVAGYAEPKVLPMPSMLRRRAGFLGKMALEVAYECLAGRVGVSTVFCSRHGEVARSVDLLADLAQEVILSPTAFGLAVHNASAGLFSIARGEQANHLALSAGAGTVEHGVIEACGLLADGEAMVLLVAYDNCLPQVFTQFEDCREQPHAWAWLMTAADADPVHLQWRAATLIDMNTAPQAAGPQAMPGSLQVWRFHAARQAMLERVADNRHWRWSRDA